MLLGLLLRGLAETFLLIAWGLHVAAVTEAQGPVQRIIDKGTELFEVIVIRVAPITHAHLNARVASKAAVAARRLVLALLGAVSPQ